MAGMIKNRYYRGPRSNHFDGQRFFIQGDAADKSKADLWGLMRTKKETWPAFVENPMAARPPSRVEGSALKVTMIGHASLLI